jgi:hypothetical protein
MTEAMGGCVVMEETQALYHCLGCEENFEDWLPPIALGIEAWPRCQSCGLFAWLVDAEGLWEWERKQTA